MSASIIIIANLIIGGLAAAGTTAHWYTSPAAGPDNIFTGNRVLSSDAKAEFPNVDATFDITLPSDVKWIVACTTITSSLDDAEAATEEPQFVVTTVEGLAYVISADGNSKQLLDYPTTLENFDPNRPPLVMTSSLSLSQQQQQPQIIELPKLSALSHPTHVFESIYIYINTEGNIVLYNLAQDEVVGQIGDVNAMLDARIVESPSNVYHHHVNNNINNHDNIAKKSSKLFAIYGGATSFSHCVLGDCLEGSTLLFIQVVVQEEEEEQNRNNNNDSYFYLMTLEREITLPPGTVFEGISPMFIENGQTIVTTVANSANGAWLRTYDVYCGDIISESSYLGWGWRHLLFYNNFAPINGTDDPLYSLVNVLTPHVQKELQFFDISSSSSGSSSMDLRASISRYTTHDIGWRNLDTGISGDFNADGINEAILLDENLQNIVSLQLLVNDDDSNVSIQKVWSLPLLGRLSSNLAAVSYNNTSHDGIALAAASGNTVRVWISTITSSQSSGDDLVATKSKSTTTTTSSSTVTTSVITSATTITENSSTSITTTTTAATTTSTAATIASAYSYDASNDELDVNFSDANTEQKNCGVQIMSMAYVKQVQLVMSQLILIVVIVMWT